MGLIQLTHFQVKKNDTILGLNAESAGEAARMHGFTFVMHELIPLGFFSVLWLFLQLLILIESNVA